MTITIYHNPACGTSRNTLALIRNTGVEPEIIEYLRHPPSRSKLEELITAMGTGARALVRAKGALYEELQLANPALRDEELIDAMMVYPALINRPIVITSLGTRLCRPSELVLEILPLPQLQAFTKEDGEKVINAAGQRIADSTDNT